jgi:hypothetical protein
MIRYKEEIPDHVRGESARDGLPAALEHKRMLMASRAPFGQNLFDFDCSCMFWLPFRVEAKLDCPRELAFRPLWYLTKIVYAKSESHENPTLAVGISPAHRSNRVIAVGTPSLWKNLLCRMGKAGRPFTSTPEKSAPRQEIKH